MGCNGWGCGYRHDLVYPDEQACYKALHELKLNQQGQLAENNGNQSAAFCAPVNGNENKYIGGGRP